MRSILITGVGGGVGQSIIKCLQGTGYRLIGADGDILGAGLYAVDHAYTIPYAAKADFVERLLEIAKAEECSMLFPGLDAELLPLARATDRFTSNGVCAVVSGPDIVAICDDKLATAQFLTSHGFPAPMTGLLSEPIPGGMPFPVVLKPRRGGARSHGVFVAQNAAEVDMHRASLPADNYVVQEQIVGDEYTCGSVNFDGRCMGVIVMRRVLRDGDTYKAFVVKDAPLTDFIEAVATRLKPFGACNFQFRLRDGTPYIFEFNARCSGTTYSRALAGFNEPLMILNYFLHGERPSFDIREITVLRYWKELVVENIRVAHLAANGTVPGNSSLL